MKKLLVFTAKHKKRYLFIFAVSEPRKVGKKPHFNLIKPFEGFYRTRKNVYDPNETIFLLYIINIGSSAFQQLVNAVIILSAYIPLERSIRFEYLLINQNACSELLTVPKPIH